VKNAPESTQVPSNIPLENQIQRVEQQAAKNYDSRKG